MKRAVQEGEGGCCTSKEWRGQYKKGKEGAVQVRNGGCNTIKEWRRQYKKREGEGSTSKE